MRIELLGGFRIGGDGDAWTSTSITSRRLQSLLAYLILHRYAPQSRRHIAFTLWPDSSEAQAHAALRKVLLRLRRSMPVDIFLDVNAQTVAWRADAPVDLDVAELEAAVRKATPEALREAVRLYRGELMPDCYEDWIVSERDRFRHLYVGALDQLIRLLEGQGDWSNAIRFAERLVRDEPLDERAHLRLVRLHALAGDRVSAVRAYKTCESVLLRELGEVPHMELRDLYESLIAIRDVGPTVRGRRASFGDELPTRVTSFVGRVDEQKAINALIAPQAEAPPWTPNGDAQSTRPSEGGAGSRRAPGRQGAQLVTLKGPGGCGKTRLAIEVAARFSEEATFVDGVFWIELAGLTDETLVPQMVCVALGLQEAHGLPAMDRLRQYLEHRHLLLVLDNCEHVVGACAQLVESLVKSAPDVHVLATSREPLGVPGEVEWLVLPLPVPPVAHRSDSLAYARTIAEYESVQLFVERAVSVLPTFRLTGQNASFVAQICQRLDGIPLAIEMAAARVTVLNVAQIATRLDDALRLLRKPSRSSYSRHGTLRATLDWSYQLLGQPERALFERLSIFAGGFSLEAAEQVCPDKVATEPIRADETGIGGEPILELLSNLVDRSLVGSAARDERTDRYRLLETSRQFAREHLQRRGLAAIARYHAEYYLALAEMAAEAFTTADRREWIERVDTENDNFRAALSWAISDDGDGELALRLAGALARYWGFRGTLTEGLDWISKALGATRVDAISPARARALFGAGLLASLQSNLSLARKYLELSVEIWSELDSPRELAFAKSTLSTVAWAEGQFEVWDRLGESSVAIMRELDDRWGLAHVLVPWGRVGRPGVDTAVALGRMQESARLWREVGDDWGLALALNNQGEVMRLQGDFRRAATLYSEARRLQLELGDKRASTVGHNLAHALLGLGESVQASYLFRECLEESLELGNTSACAANLSGLAGVAAAERKPELAVRLQSFCVAQQEATGTRLDPVDQRDCDNYLAMAGAEIDGAAYDREWTAGQTMTLESVVTLVRSVWPLAHGSDGFQSVWRGVPSMTVVGETREPRRSSPLARGRDGESTSSLTRRQREVAALIGQGRSNSAIAAILRVQPKTVEAHVTRIYKRLGVSSRAEVVAWAASMGLVLED